MSLQSNTTALAARIAFIASQTSSDCMMTVASLEAPELALAFPDSGMTERDIVYAIVKAVKSGRKRISSHWPTPFL